MTSTKSRAKSYRQKVECLFGHRLSQLLYKTKWYCRRASSHVVCLHHPFTLLLLATVLLLYYWNQENKRHKGNFWKNGNNEDGIIAGVLTAVTYYISSLGFITKGHFIFVKRHKVTQYLECLHSESKRTYYIRSFHIPICNMLERDSANGASETSRWNSSQKWCSNQGALTR